MCVGHLVVCARGSSAHDSGMVFIPLRLIVADLQIYHQKPWIGLIGCKLINESLNRLSAAVTEFLCSWMEVPGLQGLTVQKRAVSRLVQFQKHQEESIKPPIMYLIVQCYTKEMRLMYAPETDGN